MKTKIIRLSGLTSDLGIIQEAAFLVQAGGLVAFPTETVYGIAAAIPQGLNRLEQVKNRPGDKRYTLHIPDIETLDHYMPKMPFHIKKMIRTAWPGPLTVVFSPSPNTLEKVRDHLGSEVFTHLYAGGTVGIRCPDHPIATQLLAAIQSPVVAPSANQSGQPPATTARGVLDMLDGKIDLVLDGDSWAPCRYRTSSTVVAISKREIEVLREGVYSRQDIIQMATLEVLFVCTGNTCRSPMAEGFFRTCLAEKLDCTVDDLKGLGYKAGSAGVAAMEGQAASPEAIEVCREAGIDIRHHRSQRTTAPMLQQADCIFTMTQRHQQQLSMMAPEAAGKIRPLDEYEDIPDPIGGDMTVYRMCAHRIRNAMAQRIGEIIE